MNLMENVKEKVMSDSIAIANYFIDKSAECKIDITLLQLVKFVYIAHGYMLALLDKSFIESRFDRVEAWRYGPVIPNVYHTFKHNKYNPIKEKGVICLFEDKDMPFVIPSIVEEPKFILDFVWKRYGQMSANDLVDLLHQKGTPWEYYYQEGKNNVIPDEDTRLYYKAVYKKLRDYEHGQKI